MSIFDCIKSEKINFLVAGATVYVHGKNTRPVISKCVIADSENVGIFVTDGAQVSYEISFSFVGSSFKMTSTP